MSLAGAILGLVGSSSSAVGMQCAVQQERWRERVGRLDTFRDHCGRNRGMLVRSVPLSLCVAGGAASVCAI